MEIKFSGVISGGDKLSGNYTIFNSNGTPLYAGHSSDVKKRIMEHRCELRRCSKFHNGVEATDYNDEWYASIYNVGSDNESRKSVEISVHDENPSLLSSPSNGQFGRKFTEEVKAKLSASRVGERNPNYGGLSSDHKQKLSDSFKLRKTLTCPHCGKQGRGGSMTRWHFDNCKVKDRSCE